jgi:pilus assembly protein Flp/PilA
MSKLLAASTKLVRDEEGASLAEYGLLLALIAVLCVGAIALLGTKVSSMFSAASTGI